MVQIAGKYEFSSADPPPSADKPEWNPVGDIVEIKVEGNKYSFIRKGRTSVYEDGKETENVNWEGKSVKSTIKVSGNTITVNGSTQDGKTLKRVYVFSDDGYVETINFEDREIKVTFKRL